MKIARMIARSIDHASDAIGNFFFISLNNCLTNQVNNFII